MAGHAGMSWPGTAATLTFEGTACRAVFKPRGGLYRVFIDGAPVETAALNSAPYDTLFWLGQGLKAGKHTVTVYKRTEAAIGTGIFAGFEIEGAPQPARPAPTRRIEFIGGSETCGDGILESASTASPNPSSEDQYLTYASLTARAFGAESHTLCWSGIGLTRNSGGDTVTTMPSLYTRVDPTQPNRNHNFSWKPDAVVINLGAHDFAFGLPPDSAQFVASMVQFLKNIQTHHPQSRLVLVDGPLLPSNLPCPETETQPCKPSLTRWRHFNAAAAQLWNAAYPGTVSTLSLTPVAPAADTSAPTKPCAHPNAAHHLVNAGELIQHLASQLSWTDSQPLSNLTIQKSFAGHQARRPGASLFPAWNPDASHPRGNPTPRAPWILLGRRF
jgi:Carbohydrate esterase 2 N-terminal/GDSL-like Lipase/Acylhydrolase family